MFNLARLNLFNRIQFFYRLLCWNTDPLFDLLFLTFEPIIGVLGAGAGRMVSTWPPRAGGLQLSIRCAAAGPPSGRPPPSPGLRRYDAAA